MTYATIGKRAQKISQLAFLRLLQKGQAYQLEAPTLWDVDFRTAVAQAELEDREMPGAYHKIRFARADGGGVVEIDTTRPELIPACVALVAHPDDARYQPLFGTEVVTPLFGVKVPIRAHHLADPDKGTGIAMICTFGDLTDVIWWRELGLPVRSIIEANGTLRPITFGSDGWPSVDPARADAAYAPLVGRGASQARTRLVEQLKESGDLIGDPRPITHAVKFFEKGDRPLEIVTSRQWFVRTMNHRESLIARGRALEWHPPYMRARFENWVEGLNGDWCVSRQRFFGVPFPVWYPLDQDGAVRYDQPLLPTEAQLPMDPSTDVPAGYEAAQRGVPGGFIGDPDVMDTWATSSLTPQIVGQWGDDEDFFGRVFPLDLRPQAHDIIRTWLFSTVLRAHLEHDALPWKHAAISGWVLDPDRKKMSKSKGNVVTPMGLLEEHGSDAVRYWAASGRPGADTAFDTGQMRVGRRLAIKLLNAAKFALARTEPIGAITAPVDRGLVTRLASLVTEATSDLEEYNYTRALERTEQFFWDFCDNYLELVKARRYGDLGLDGAGSANAAMVVTLRTLLRLFAPFLPYVTEEVWSWWQEGSVHRATWPTADEVLASVGGAGDAAGAEALTMASWALGEIRRTKSEAKKPLRTPVVDFHVTASAADLVAFDAARADVAASGFVQQVRTSEGEARAATVELGELEKAPEVGA
jgi:valyl-tRNA synthetase